MDKKLLNYKSCMLSKPLFEKARDELISKKEKLEAKGIKPITCKGYQIKTNADIEDLVSSDIIDGNKAVELMYKLEHCSNQVDFQEQLEVYDCAINYLNGQVVNCESNIRTYEHEVSKDAQV